MEKVCGDCKFFTGEECDGGEWEGSEKYDDSEACRGFVARFEIVTCPSCESSINVADFDAGDFIMCMRCHNHFSVDFEVTENGVNVHKKVLCEE